MLCEVCKIPFPFLESHHIISKSKGGDNKKLNKTNVCPNCHELIHRGLIILEGKVSSTAGYILIWRNKGEPSITGKQDPDVFTK